MTQRQAAKRFNVPPDSVAKMVAYSTPPDYQGRSPILRPKLDAFVSTIEHWPDEDLKVPRKQQCTTKLVFDRLYEKCGLTDGATIIKDYMRERDQRRHEVFAPLSHPPRHPQADFGEATGDMLQPDVLVAMLRLNDLGRSAKRLSKEFGCGHQDLWLRGYVDLYQPALRLTQVVDSQRVVDQPWRIMTIGRRKWARQF
uniref:hypothetical protein n=1 Tax=Agrobacterium vitis TaxID=373 RepID=UPI001F36A225|nr:hypothetical protein [Agrobacterium vitis]